MSSRKIKIDELRLRAPGLTRAQAQQLGRLVAQRLSEISLPAGGARKLKSVSVNVRSTRGSLEGMAAEIANRISTLKNLCVSVSLWLFF